MTGFAQLTSSGYADFDNNARHKFSQRIDARVFLFRILLRKALAGWRRTWRFYPERHLPEPDAMAQYSRVPTRRAGLPHPCGATPGVTLCRNALAPLLCEPAGWLFPVW